jgi:hypothetical protein
MKLNKASLRTVVLCTFFNDLRTTVNSTHFEQGAHQPRQQWIISVVNLGNLYS